ncbi:tata-box binding protein [Dermatophagoides farinae]|uniref:Tata-box binding protein n=1 Tax=Dermatophagoides farinae TaxID=6954 RepID=A0A9D4P7R0_DERFA|nr:tata-box binding protein [Dermatophagoides farinae]
MDSEFDDCLPDESLITTDFNHIIDGDNDEHSFDNQKIDDDGNNQSNELNQPPVQPPQSMINIRLDIDEPVVHNIVATANFNCRLELSKIVTRVRNAEYNPKRFCAVIMRIFEPRTTAMLFASGKIVVTGAKNERLACLACRKYGRIVQKLGYDVKFSEFKVQNIVSTVDMKFPIRLDKLAIYHGQFCTYDPDFFPALIYRMVRPRTVLLIFVSGKLIITGARSRTEMMETMEHIGPVLCSYRK